MNETSLYANCRGGGAEAWRHRQRLSARDTEHCDAHLLAETDARPGVEGQEDERVRREVPRGAPVEEAVGVELVCCVNVSAMLLSADTCVSPSGPQRSFLRCIMKTEYRILQALW